MVDYPQKGKSRLFTIADEIFKACNKLVTETAETMVRTAAQSAEASGFQATLGDDGEIPPITVKTFCLQSFTFTEFFFRNSVAFQHIEYKDNQKPTTDCPLHVWHGRAHNLDEAYEFWDGLSLTGPARSDKDRATIVHASTLNALVEIGKKRRATTTSASVARHLESSFHFRSLEMVIPAKVVPMDRAMVGNHTACTKERFIFCLDRAVARHAALPDDCELRDGATAWTWLPLTSQQAPVCKWSRFIDNPAEARTHLSECVPEESAQTTGEQEGVEFIAPGGYKIEFPDDNESRLRFLVQPASDETFALNFKIPAR